MNGKIPSVRKPALIILTLLLISVTHPARHAFARRDDPFAPVHISMISGDRQSDGVGSPLDRPFVVEVLGDYNRVLTFTEVEFTVLAGGGTVTPDVSTDPKGKPSITVTTDFLGKARATLILGMTAETNTVEARAGDIGHIYSHSHQLRAGA